MQSKIVTRYTALSFFVMLCVCAASRAGSATSANSGVVSAPFVVGADARYVLNVGVVQSSGPLSTSEQDSKGAFTALGSYALTGSPTVTKDLNGDATYAMGRWQKGTVTSSGASMVLSGADSRAVHYLVFNLLVALPIAGKPSCDNGAFTAPNAINASRTAPISAADYFASSTGSATLSFSADGAAVAVNIKTLTSSSSGMESFTSTVPNVTTSSYTGTYLKGGAGAMLSLGDGGNGSYLIVTPYRIALASGVQYQGQAVFHCR